MVPLTAPCDRVDPAVRLDARARRTVRAASASTAAARERPGGPNRMSRLERALLCVAAATLFSTRAQAQITDHPIEASAGAGFFHYDVRAYTKDGPGYTGALGWRAASWLSLEGSAV